MMDKATAQRIYDDAAREIDEIGYSTIETFKAVKATDANELEFFFMERPGRMIFNLGRWKKRYEL